MKKIVIALTIALMTLCGTQAWAQGGVSCEKPQVVTTSPGVTAVHSRNYEGVWYNFTPTVSGVYKFSSCGHSNSSDTKVTVYSGRCESQQIVGEDDDGSCSGYSMAANLTVSLTAGTTYMVKWHLYSGDLTYTWELVRPMSAVLELNDIPDGLNVSGSVYRSADSSSHIADFDAASNTVELGVGNTYYYVLKGDGVASGFQPFVANDTVQISLADYKKMVLKVTLPADYVLSYPSSDIYQDESIVATAEFTGSGALYTDTLYMADGIYSIGVVAADAQGANFPYKHTFTVSSAGDININVSTSGLSKRTFSVTDLPTELLSASTVMYLYDEKGNWLTGVDPALGCYLSNGTYSYRVLLSGDVPIIEKKGTFTVIGTGSTVISYANYSKTTFRVQLLDGYTWSSANIFSSGVVNDYVTSLSNGDSVVYLPNDTYYAMMSFSPSGNATVHFTVGGGNTIVRYAEVKPVFVLSDIPEYESLDIIGNIYEDEDLNNQQAAFGPWSSFVTNDVLTPDSIYYCQLNGAKVVRTVAPFVATDTVRLTTALKKMAVKVSLPVGWLLEDFNPAIYRDGYSVAYCALDSVGSRLFADTLYMPSDTFSIAIKALDVQGVSLHYKHDFTVSASGDVLINVGATGYGKQTFTFTNLPTGFVAPDTTIVIYDDEGAQVNSLQGTMSCYLPHGTYFYMAMQGANIAINAADLTVSGDASIAVSYADYYKTTFRVQLVNSDSWTGAEVYNHSYGDMVASIAYGDSVAYLPNDDYYVNLYTANGYTKVVDFTVSGANSVVTYAEVFSVFTFTDLPAQVVSSITGNIYSDADLNNYVTYFYEGNGYQSDNPLIAGTTYYCQLQGSKVSSVVIPFTATDTVRITTSVKQTIVKVNLPAGWSLNTAVEVRQNDQYVAYVNLDSVAPQQYADTLYVPNGDYTCAVTAFDLQGTPFGYPHTFTVSAAGEVNINVSAAGQTKQAFTLTNLPTGLVLTDTLIEIYDTNGNMLLDMYGAAECYLPNGTYSYGVKLNQNVATKAGNFTVSGAGTVSISFSGYYKIDFRAALPAGESLIYVDVRDRTTGDGVVNLWGGDTTIYLPNGAYNATLGTTVSNYRVSFTVSGANRVAAVELVNARFTIVNVPVNLLGSVVVVVYDESGSWVQDADARSNFTAIALVKGATYGYEVYDNNPSPKLVGEATGTFVADTAVTLSVYSSVALNVTAPGEYRVRGAFILQNTSNVGYPIFGAYPPCTDTFYMARGVYMLSVLAMDTVTNTLHEAYKNFIVTSTYEIVTLNMATDFIPQLKFVVSNLPVGISGGDVAVEISGDGLSNPVKLHGISDSVTLTNGTYSYEVYDDNADKLLPVKGSFTVGSSNQTLYVSFADYHKVTFGYTLPVGEVRPEYYIDLYRQGQTDALTYINISSGTTSHTYYLPNGTYAWALENYRVWTGAQQPFTVNGADTTVTYVMQPMYKVAFVPTGNFATRTDYSVSMRGGVDQSIEHRSGSRTDSLRLPAGTYQYEVAGHQGTLYVNGTEAAPYSGTFTVGSSGQTVNVSFENYRQVSCTLTTAEGTVMPSGYVNVIILKGGNTYYSMGVNVNRMLYLPEGTYTFRVAQSGYKNVEQTVSVTGNLTNVRLELQSGSYYQVAFYVSDNEGKDVAGASVTLADDNQMTDTYGEALFADVAEGNIAYSVTKSGYQSVSGTMYVGQGINLHKSVTLSPLYSVSFDVYDGATGTTRLSGATVLLQGYGTLSTANTTVTFSNVVAGSYAYSVSKDGYVLQTGSVTVIAGSVTKTINLVREQPYTIKVAVYDGSTTTYLSGATVSLTGQTAQNVSGDTVRFTGLTAGAYTASVSKTGYFTQSTDITLSPATVGANRSYTLMVNMMVKPANLKKYTLTFKVYDGSSSNLLSGASVVLTGGETKITTNAPLSFANVDSGDVVAYTVSKSGYVTASGTQQVTATHAVNDTVFVPAIQLQTTPRYAIEFKVYDGTGATYLAGASVELQGQTTQTTVSAPLTFGNLLPGSYTYSVSKSGYASQSGTLTVNSSLDIVGRTLTQIINLIADAPQPNAVDKNTIAVQLYPNPANGTIYLKSDNADAVGTWSVKVYTVNGVMVMHTQTYLQNQADINISTLQPGTYILYMSKEGKHAVQKLMVK